MNKPWGDTTFTTDIDEHVDIIRNGIYKNEEKITKYEEFKNAMDESLAKLEDVKFNNLIVIVTNQIISNKQLLNLAGSAALVTKTGLADIVEKYIEEYKLSN